MMNVVLRMNRSKNGGNQFFQDVLGDLLRSAVRLAPIVERTARSRPTRHRACQPRDPVSIFFSADAAVKAVGQKLASLSTLPDGSECFHWERQLTMHSMHGISENRLLHFQGSLFFNSAFACQSQTGDYSVIL